MVTQRIINRKLLSCEGFEHLYPFAPHYIRIDGHTLHYLDEGEGPVILMVHGNPTWSFYFRHMVKGLSGHFRVLVPDHVGCGFSDKPSPASYDYTLASRVKDLDAFVARTAPSGKINLIVHDWGGMIGLSWALDHPDRIDKIVVTNTAGFFLPRGKRFPFLLWLIKHLDWFARPAVLGLNLFSAGALYLAAESRLCFAVKKGLTAPYDSPSNRIATLKFVQDIPLNKKDKSFSVVDKTDKRLSRLKDDQLLLLWGAKDFVFDPAFFNEFKRRFPRAKSHLFEDAGHYLFEDKPLETLGIIRDFLGV